MAIARFGEREMGEVVQLFPPKEPEPTEEEIIAALRAEVKDFLLDSEDEIFKPYYFMMADDPHYCPCCGQHLDHPIFPED
jgi:hypothetical protein